MRAENSWDRVALSSLRLASCLRIFDQTFELEGESESVVPRAGVHLVLTSTPGPSQYVRFQLTLLHDNLLSLSRSFCIFRPLPVFSHPWQSRSTEDLALLCMY